MKFDELDEKMRVFETTNDPVVLPAVHIVARIDGRIEQGRFQLGRIDLDQR